MFVDSPTEQTTAVTDLLIAVQCVGVIVLLNRIDSKRPMWTDVWKWFFGLLCLASALGAAAHGIHMSTWLQTAIWATVYLALGLIMALFAVAAVTMTWSGEMAKRCLPLGIGIALSFFAITQLWSDSFMLFVVYEAIAMIGALVLYAACYWFRSERGSGFLVAGILVGIAAAIVDTQSALQLTLIWTFDNHGMFHMVQMVSLLLTTIGIHLSHRVGQVQPC